MTAQEIRSTVDEMVVAALELVNDFDQTDEAAIDDVTASRPELRSLVALCFDRQEGSECLSDEEIATAMVAPKPELITPAVAQRMGADAARWAYREWSSDEDPAQAVWRGGQRLDDMLGAYGLAVEDHSDLWEVAGAAFRDTAEDLFGGDHVVAGQ